MLSEDEFDIKYIPIEADDSSMCFDHDDDQGFVQFMIDYYPRHVWTAIEGGTTENIYILNGVHTVNRMYFVITEKPCELDFVEALWFEYGKE